jgi:hypothetical protein
MWPFRRRLMNRAYILGRKRQILADKRILARAHETLLVSIVQCEKAQESVRRVLSLNESIMAQNDQLLAKVEYYRREFNSEPPPTHH